MKTKLLILSFVILSIFGKSQYYNDNTIRIELTENQRYTYEAELNRLRANSYKKETADLIKNWSDKFTTELRRLNDFYKDKPINLERYKNEISRLQNYNIEILDLLGLLESNDLTQEKMKYTIEKAFSELNYSSKNGELKSISDDFSDKHIESLLINESDNVLEILINKNTGYTPQELKEHYAKSSKTKSYRDFLIQFCTQILKHNQSK